MTYSYPFPYMQPNETQIHLTSESLLIYKTWFLPGKFKSSRWRGAPSLKILLRWVSVNAYKNIQFRNWALYFLSWPTSSFKPLTVSPLHPSGTLGGTARPFCGDPGYFSLSQTEDLFILPSLSLPSQVNNWWHNVCYKFSFYSKVDWIGGSKNSGTEMILRWTKQ